MASTLAVWATVFTSAGTAFALFSACGKSSSKGTGQGETPTGPGGSGAVGKLQLGVAASGYKSPASSLALDDNSVSAPPFRATSILSGSPDLFTVYIRKITLNGKTSTGAQTSVTVFEDPAGKPLRVEGSQVDLSELFTTMQCFKLDGTPFPLKEGEKCECGVDASGKLIKKTNMVDPKTGKSKLGCEIKNTKKPPVGLVDITEGTYTGLTVQYANKADIQGCLSGYFRNTSTGVGDTAVPHTYCTRTEGSLFTGSGSVNLATFEDQEPQVMDTVLTGLSANAKFSMADKEEITYPIGSDLKLEAGKTARLTLLIDTNRLLRFETAIRDDANVQKDGWPKSRPFFYSNIFRSSSFVFVGEPGEIRGYKWKAYACENAPATCQGNQQAFYLEGWLTTIARKNADPFLLSFMPDDDATLTTIAGNNLVQSQGPNGVLQTPHPKSYVKNADGTVLMTYALDGKTGEVTLKSAPGAVGETVEGTFAGFQELTGELTLERKL